MAKLLCDTWKGLYILSSAVAADKNKRISLKERFAAYDKLSTGFVTVETFLLVLTKEISHLVAFSHEEASQLAKYFEIADGRIDYCRLCSVINDSVKEMQGGADHEGPDSVVVNKLLDCEENRVKFILTHIAEKLQEFKVIPGLNIKAGDGIKSTISNAEFGRLLNFLGICLTPLELSLLTKKFAKDSFYVSYKGFLQSIQEISVLLSQGKDEPQCNPNCHNSLPLIERPNVNRSCIRPNTLTCGNQACCSNVLTCGDYNRGKASELECIMDRIRMRLKFRRIDLRRQFHDWDKQNIGRILKRRFWSTLQDAGFFFTFDEIAILELCYLTEHGMDYLCFLRDLNLEIAPFFPTKVGHPSGREAVASGRFNEQGLGMNCGKINDGESRIFRAKKRKIAHSALIKLAKCPPLNLKEIFNDQDKCNEGGVTKQQFLKALGRRNMDYLLSPKELSELCDELKNKKGLVSYRTLEAALSILRPFC